MAEKRVSRVGRVGLVSGGVFRIVGEQYYDPGTVSQRGVMRRGTFWNKSSFDIYSRRVFFV